MNKLEVERMALLNEISTSNSLILITKLQPCAAIVPEAATDTGELPTFGASEKTLYSMYSTLCPQLQPA